MAKRSRSSSFWNWPRVAADSSALSPDAAIANTATSRPPALGAIAPALFVLFWSTGFIGAKYGLPYAEPFTFLFVRMTIAFVLLTGVTFAVRARFPRTLAEIGHVAVSGLLLHAGYLGGVFYAIDRGMPAGLSSLIVGLQPILTAVLAQAMLRERVTSRQWAGLALGFVGVGLVVEEKVSASLDNPIAGGAFVAVGIALLATTGGTLYQKRFVTRVDLTASAAIQYLAAAIVLGIAAFGFESMEIAWTGRFVFALGWLIVVLSVGAILLLLRLIRENSVSRISSLLYLVPPMTAIEAYLLFDERLGLVAIVGMVCVVAGVAMVVRSQQAAARAR
ncbi:MAG: DMT family transporter [Thermomicrobiales bacterium]|nr:DMT family transporter [Thermomicrobiales bacterium]